MNFGRLTYFKRDAHLWLLYAGRKIGSRRNCCWSQLLLSPVLAAGGPAKKNKRREGERKERRRERRRRSCYCWPEVLEIFAGLLVTGGFPARSLLVAVRLELLPFGADVVVGGPRRKEDKEEAPSWPPATAGCCVASAGIADLSSDGERGRGKRELTGDWGRPVARWFFAGVLWFRQ
ncbi:hypothetical protein H5410_050562 [Solanum commersonii]|uniref:Uncharacterized protein n=1 Tax=Solanum commersonii TaxID=4109 RepID=A0A9J5WX49_SOLCO|nr:hypothetical protein H5410_050562 [Solanum commersonii]